MISGNVPTHLLAAAKSGFLLGQKNTPMPWQRIASVTRMGAKSIDLVDLGGAPMPTRNRAAPQVQQFIEKKLTITPVDWDITVDISGNAVADDQTDTLLNRVKGAGANFQRHINDLVFAALDAGDASTYGLGYDNNEFFDDSHVDAGAAYSTAQDNKYGLTLSLDNFTTVAIAAAKFRDDQGSFISANFNLLVVPPDLEYTAANICRNGQAMDTSSREANAFAGRVDYIVSPQLNTTAWMLLAADEVYKPLILAMREEPNLQAAWYDPKAPDGGRFYFKFFARYNIFYGDWRMAIMGNT